MIISRTPLRMSFTGGGSDIPAFYRKFGGAVLSTAIDKYVYVNVNKKFNEGVRIAYSKTEEVHTIAEIEHPIVRTSMDYLKLNGGIEITTIADIPSKGTGLGSSSTFTVGLLHSLNAFMGKYVSSDQLASDSCHVEINLCGEPIGKQDQYAAAYGGFNIIEFKPDESVIVSPIICDRKTLLEIEQNIIMFYTGKTRSASVLLKQQSSDLMTSSKHQAVLQQMVKLTYDLRDELHKNNSSVFGEILDKNWHLKKTLNDGISNNDIESMYSAGRNAGALGGKILGAGAGGFMMFYAPTQFHEDIKKALSPLRHIPVKFDPLGSRIIFYN